jgi:hypothetical protein
MNKKTEIKLVHFVDWGGMLLHTIAATPDLLKLIDLMEAGMTHNVYVNGTELWIRETEETR